MPGQAACFRCGSLLEAKAGAVEVHPPRAPAWKKPFRRAARWVRRYGAARSAGKFARRAADRTAAVAFGRAGLPDVLHSAGVPRRGDLWRALRDAAVALALSIVPGLAHAARHQFRAIRLYVISWFVSLVIGILFFGQSLGAISMATAFVLHAWIAMDAVLATKQFKEKMTALARIGWRLCGIACFVFLLYVIYMQVEHAVGFTVGLADIAVPAHQVKLGDSILCRYLPASEEPPPLRRGDLVLVPGREMVYGDGAIGTPRAYVGEIVTQLLALPGDELRLSPDGFTVNGRALDPLKFPIPASLRGQFASLRLGKDEYFVTMEMRTAGYGVARAAEVNLRACVYQRPDVLARGVMRWFPIWNRGFLEALE